MPMLQQFQLRLTEQMKEQLKQEAVRNHRTLHSEIIYRLERSLAPGKGKS